MIDVESKIITLVKQEIGDEAEIGSTYTNMPSSFPYISVIEQDNYLIEEDDGDSEKYAVLMYEVTVYTDNSKGAKTKARKLLNKVDKLMYRLNFTRTSLTPAPNMDSSVFRIVARYEVVTDGETFYRR